jgi:SAM-dependent methyltransferase
MTTLASSSAVNVDPQMLQCIDCGGELDCGAIDLLTCRRCQRRFPIRDGVVNAINALQGSNKIAAEFYDSRWWERYQVWERIAFILTGGERRFRTQFLKWLPPLSGRRLLDIGIGEGGNVRYVPEDCEIFGVDISASQLEKCRRIHPTRTLRLFLTEAEHLPLRDASVDHAVSWGAFNLFTDRTAALKEIARVVRPGGVIVIGDETPGLVKLLPGQRLRMPGLDHWLLHRVVALGPGFSSLLQQHQDLDISREARQILPNAQMHSVWAGACYFIVATVPKAA